jgi:CheY-like chemotaxis protein
MFSFGGAVLDVSLLAAGAIIWMVAIGIAFGFYLPAARAGGASWRLFPAPTVPELALEPGAEEDLDHAPMPPVLAAVFETLEVSPPPAPATPDPALPPPERPEVFSALIVDDNAINRQVLEMILDSAGVGHVSVENGLEAVEAMTACAYDVVLMDLQMPVMDGFEATRRIRDLEAARGGAPATIIVVSANCLEEDVLQSLAAGGDRHLPKPVSPGALIAELVACEPAHRMAA